MNTFKKLYKEFFGLKEAAVTPGKTNVPGINPNDAKQLAVYNKELEKTQKLMKGMTEDTDLDEAQLINHITDYNGGVEYVLRNPAEAKQVSVEIRDWAEKKGFVVLKQKISSNGKVGYFYFKLGQDPALESQRIQGYIAQKPEIKHFRFNVRGQKKPEVRPENPSM
jgi:hypothetical protein